MTTPIAPRFRLRRSLSFTPPAERLVQLHAWDTGVEWRVDRRPVVSLCTCEELTYERTSDAGGHDARGDYICEDARGAHYVLRESRLVVSPVIVDPCMGLTVWEEDVESAFPRLATAVVVCPWPPSDDDARLRDHEARVLEEAQRRALLTEGCDDRRTGPRGEIFALIGDRLSH